MDEEKATLRKRGKHIVGFSLALMCILYSTTLWNIHRAQQRYCTLNHFCFTKNVFSISLFKFTTIDDAAISKTERFQSWYFLVASLVSPINEIKWLTNWYKKQALQITKDLRDIKKYQTPVLGLEQYLTIALLKTWLLRIFLQSFLFWCWTNLMFSRQLTAFM